MLSDLLTMAKSAETGSTKSSTISSKAASIKKTIKRSAKAIAQPFKKVKQSFYTHSATCSIASHSSFPNLIMKPMISMPNVSLTMAALNLRLS